MSSGQLDSFDGVSLEELKSWIDDAWNDMEDHDQMGGLTTSSSGTIGCTTSERLEEHQTTADLLGSIQPAGQSSAWNLPTSGLNTGNTPLVLQNSQVQNSEISLTNVSSIFGPTFSDPKRQRPADIVLVSSDSIAFYVDEATLLNASTNHFNNQLLPIQKHKQGRFLFLPQLPSSELQIILQIIYDVFNDSNTGQPPQEIELELETVIAAIDHLPTYGIPTKTFITRDSYLFRYILSQASLHPLECYTLAAFHEMHDLAVDVSSYTLVLASELPNAITMPMAEKMGPSYLLKLLQLHSRRVETLKELLSVNLEFHPVNEHCGFEKQRMATKAWHDAVMQLSWNLKANTSTFQIRETMLDKTKEIECEGCIQSRDVHLEAILEEWSLMSRTII